MKIYLLIGLYDDDETIIAAFDSHQKAARAMYMYNEDEYDDMWIKEMEVQ